MTEAIAETFSSLWEAVDAWPFYVKCRAVGYWLLTMALVAVHPLLAVFFWALALLSVDQR